MDGPWVLEGFSNPKSTAGWPMNPRHPDRIAIVALDGTLDGSCWLSGTWKRRRHVTGHNLRDEPPTKTMHFWDNAIHAMSGMHLLPSKALFRDGNPGALTSM